MKRNGNHGASVWRAATVLALALGIAWAMPLEAAPEGGDESTAEVAADRAFEALVHDVNTRIGEAGSFTDELKEEVATELGAFAEAHPGTESAVTALANQATVEEMLGRYEAAESVLKRAMEATKKEEVRTSLEWQLRKLALRPGTKLPEFSVTTLDGTTVSAADYRGKVLLIDFWATWCTPCIVELPVLKQAHADYGAAGFEILGISVDEDPDKLRSFIESEGMTWTHVHDLSWTPRGKPEELANRFGVRQIPHTILVDPEGTILATNLRGEAMLETVRAAVANE
jgi:peroxiredoxin